MPTITYGAHIMRIDKLRAERLQARWKGAAGPGTCGVPWPPSLDDVETIHCHLSPGHLHRTRHEGLTGWSPDHTLEWD